MRSPPVSTWVLLGVGGGLAAVTYRKLERMRHARPAMVADPARAARIDRARDRARSRALDREPPVIPDSYAVDPADPVQVLGDVHEFDVDDLGVDALSAADVETELDATLDGRSAPTLDMIEMAVYDGGDGPLLDPAALEEGQTWLEALETRATEIGAAPGRDLVMDDSEDVDTRDLPVADRGSGGPGGI